MHPKLAAATTLPKLSQVTLALGLTEALDLPLSTVIEEMPERSFSRALLASLARRFQVTTLGALLAHPEAARWLDRQAPAESVELVQHLREAIARSAQRSAEAPAAAGGEEVFRTEEALDAWIDAHGVRDLLDAPLARALEGHPDARVRRAAVGARGRRTIRKVLFPSSVSLEDEPLLEEDFDRAEIAKIHAAAFAYLEGMAGELAEALGEEAARTRARRPSRRVGARRLEEALLAAREETRRRARPRPAARITESRLQVVENGPGRFTLQYNEVAARELGRPGAEHAFVSIPIDAFEDTRAAARCSCTPRAANACTHALAAIDTALDLIPSAGKATEVSPSPELERLLHQLEEPRWAATLEALDQAILKSSDLRLRAEDYRLWWQIIPGLSGLELNPWLQKRGRRGELGRPKPVSFERLAEEPEMLSLPADRKVLDMIAPPWLRLTPHQRAMLMSRAFPRVLRAIALLVHHPRVFYGEDPDHALSVRGGRLELVLEEGEDGTLRFTPRLDGEALAPDVLLSLILDPNTTDVVHRLDLQSSTFTLIALDGPQRALLLALARHGFAFPKEARREVVRRLPELARVLALRMGSALTGRRVEAGTRPMIRLEPVESSLKVEVLMRPLPDGPMFAPGEGPIEVLDTEAEGLVVTERALEREVAATRAALAQLDLAPNEGPPHFMWILDDLERALGLCAQLREHAGELDVEWAKTEPWRVTRRATSSDLRLSVQDGKRWFALVGSLEVEGERVSLAEALDAVRRKKKFVRVGEGRWVAIADELRQRLGRVEDAIFREDGELALGPAAILAIEELSRGAGSVELSERFRALSARLDAARTEEAPLPELGVTLREYQLSGYRWLMRLAGWGAGACLADDMGLGKTIQAIAALAARSAEGPAIVVAPTSVGFNWVREITRAAPHLAPIAYRESDRARVFETLAPGHVLIVSYGLLVRDVERFRAAHFATAVFDEAQAIKNPGTRRAEAVRSLDARWRVALTGTPIENHLGELWSLFSAISPGLLGTLPEFRERFALPIERDRDASRRAALANLIRPFVLRRTKAEVAKELPPRTEIRLEVELSTEERRLYETVRRAALETLEKTRGRDGEESLEIGEDRRFQVLAAITRLRQLACHPRLYDEGSAIPSSKLARLMSLLESLRDEGHRALVFSQFTRHLALVRRALETAGFSYLYLDGSTPAGERARLVDAFQEGDATVFLISLKAGGTGLNLTAADYVVLLDPWWNPAVEDQATDRAHRIGQARPVTVYRLVARRTIEEAILAESAEKRRLVADLLEGADVAAKVSTEELVRLIREGALADLDADDETSDDADTSEHGRDG